MFGGYEDAEVFEDALYQGTSRSSSESDVDSEAEFNLYGLMHYAQDLGIYEKPEDSDKTEGSEQVKKQGHTSNDFTCSINSSQSSKKSPFMFHKPDIICLDSEDSSAIVIDSDTSVIMYVSEKEISTVEDATCKEKVAPIPEECSKEFGDQNVHLTEPLDTSKEQNEVVHATKKKKPRREKRVAGDKGKCLKAGKRVQQSDVALELQSSDEDSSSVHSWMLLDDEYESDNKDIWLNVVSGGNNFGKWAMNNRDLQACIVNQKRATVKGAQSKGGRLHKKNSRPYDWCNKQKPHFQARRQGRKHPRCNICGNLGHLRVTCPFLPCYLCRCPGHLAQDCIEGPTNSQCRRCRMMGHIVDDCPDIWRQFHLTTQCGPIIQGAAYNYCQEQPKFCYNCAGCGHFGHECHRKRMGNGIFPTTPFVCHYDHNREIWERDMRSEKRSLELQKRGMLNSSMVNLTIQQCLDDTDDFCRNTPKRARKGQHWKNGQHNSKPYWLFHKRFERGQQTEGRPTSTGFVRNGPKKLLGQRRSRRDHTSEAAARLRNQKWHPTTYAAPVGREPKGKRPKPTVKKKKKAKNNVSPTMCVPLRGKGRKINRRGKGGFVDYIQ